LANAHAITAITLTGNDIAGLSLTAAERVMDAAVLADIMADFSVTLTASGNEGAIAGVPNALGTTVSFAGAADQYVIIAPGDGVSVTVSGNGAQDRLSNIQAVKFSDLTDIVAQTPGSGAVTSGNVAELYGAAFGRLPDVAGLAYYEGLLKANPSLPLSLFAQWFLASPEYVGNASHNYAQTIAGDTQFITDSYNNLLHRAPETGAIPYYLNLINQFTQGLTPGTSAYSSAEALAHAHVIADFSASTEFLNDVQVTAQTKSSAQHWLILV
jgi:hypothetical protein